MKVTSGQIDHTKLGVGLHLLEVLDLGGIKVYSYDLRFVKPILQQVETFRALDSAVIHSIEHFLAKFVRESAIQDNFQYQDVLSVFPYGCKTGFGCLSTINPKNFRPILLDAIKMACEADYIPFSRPEQCGNIFLNCIGGAHTVLSIFWKVVAEQTEDSILNVPMLEELQDSKEEVSEETSETINFNENNEILDRV